MNFLSQISGMPNFLTNKWDQLPDTTCGQTQNICLQIEELKEPTTTFTFHGGLLVLTTALGALALLRGNKKPLDSFKAVIEFGKTGLTCLFQKIHVPSLEEDRLKQERVLNYLKREFLNHTALEMTLMNALYFDQMQTLFKFDTNGEEKKMEAIAVKKAYDAVQTIQQCYAEGFLFDNVCFSTPQKEQMLKNLGLEEAIIPIQSRISFSDCCPWSLYMQAMSLAMEGKISIDVSSYEKASFDVLNLIEELMRPDKKKIAEALAATAAILVKDVQPRLSGSTAFEESHGKVVSRRVFLEHAIRFYADMEMPLSELDKLDPQNPYRVVIGALRCEEFSTFFWNKLHLKQIYQTEYTKNPTLWDQPMTLPQLVAQLKAEGDEVCAW